MAAFALRMPEPADRIARRTDSAHASSKVVAIRALSHLRAPEQTQAPADRIARRL